LNALSTGLVPLAQNRDRRPTPNCNTAAASRARSQGWWGPRPIRKGHSGTVIIEILVDADACPVKDEIYAVASRYGLRILLVANSRMAVPPEIGVELVVVGEGADVADDWIAENIGEDDIAITADIPLAARCLERGARVLGPNGREFTEDSIGGALATRALNSELREMGVLSGGPRPIQPKDRSRFLSKLDQLIQAGPRRRDM
jgi:uncharacterized protein YaiI (UPF0178 family)